MKTESIDVIEPCPVADIFATGVMQTEEPGGIVCLTFYRDRRSTWEGRYQIERVVVSRIVVPASAVPQLQRCVSQIAHGASPADVLMASDVKGTA